MSIGRVWSSLRGILDDEFSFYDIKRLCGEAGLSVTRLAHMSQKQGSYTTKGRLLDGIDGLVEELDPAERDRFVAACIEDILCQRPESAGRLEELLHRVGWGLAGATPYPLELSVDIEFSELPEDTRHGLELALRRYRDGDVAGTFSAICGMIDDVTRRVYEANPSLGDFGSASYHERVAKAFRTYENGYKESLVQSGMPEGEVRLVWENHSKAISQAGYVLGAFRRNYADVHGVTSAPRDLVQHALDAAVFVLRWIYRISAVDSPTQRVLEAPRRYMGPVRGGKGPERRGLTSYSSLTPYSCPFHPWYTMICFTDELSTTTLE